MNSLDLATIAVKNFLNMCMNKAELAAKVAERLKVSKKSAEDFVAAFEDVVTQTLANEDEVTIAGFGTFSARVRKGRIGVNPQNPSEPITIPPVFVPKFKAGKALKDTLKAAGKSRGVGGNASSSSSAPASDTPLSASQPSTLIN